MNTGTNRTPIATLPTVYDDLQELLNLPKDIETWRVTAPHSGAGTVEAHGDVIASLKAASVHGSWRWPARPVVFISDTHADPDGFLRSLAGAGVVRRTGYGSGDFHLTRFGETAQVVIGGDCLDKGPSNLGMLDALGAFLAAKPDAHLLAGNHDLRLKLAIEGLTGPRSPLSDHLFLRMGRKILPLLAEVWDRYLARGRGLTGIPGEADCRRLLVPGDDWREAFPIHAARYMSDAAIAKEMKRLREKQQDFDTELGKVGLTARQLVAAAVQCRELFFEPDGQFAWFYDRMDAACQFGSLLFVHAGIDDEICDLIARGGISAVNARYRRDARDHPLAFYFGCVGNLARTKYRAADRPLSQSGVQDLHAAGIKMVVHGHVNNHAGQRLLARGGLLHLEGDVTLDRASRQSEGLPGVGAGATLVFPSGDVLGLSSDYPRAKHFNPTCKTWENCAA